jgi:hypothetical protein
MSDDDKFFDFDTQQFNLRPGKRKVLDPSCHWQYAAADSSKLKSRDVYMLMYKRTTDQKNEEEDRGSGGEVEEGSEEGSEVEEGSEEGSGGEEGSKDSPVNATSVNDRYVKRRRGST